MLHQHKFKDFLCEKGRFCTVLGILGVAFVGTLACDYCASARHKMSQYDWGNYSW